MGVNLGFQLLLVGSGGLLGAVFRYLITRLAAVILPENLAHLGVFACNLLGCIAAGILIAILNPLNTQNPAYLFLVTGLLGALTTFSTFSLNNLSLLQGGRYAEAILYTFGSVIFSLGFCFLAYMLTDKLLHS